MLFLGIMTYPGPSAMDVAKLAIEIVTTTPYPEYIKRNYYIKIGGDGIKQYTLFDIEKGREEEGLREVYTRLVRFVTTFDDFKCTLEPLYPVEEAMAMISMAAPPELGSLPA